MKAKEYQRLPGSGRRGGFVSLSVTVSRCTLWLGKDHVLSVDSQGYREEYKRFYFRDIQAIIVRKTKRSTVVNILLGLFGCLLFGVAIFTSTDRAFWWPISAVGFVPLIGNLLLGPTCVCHLRTAVHTEQLPSLQRARTARKALGILKPLIEQTQGPLAVEQLAPAPAAPSPSPQQTLKQPKPIQHYHGTVHLYLFALLIVDGAWTYLHFPFRHVGLVLGSIALAIALAILTVIALVRQHESDMTPAIRRLVLATMGFLCIGFVVGYVESFMTAINSPELASNYWEVIKMYASRSPSDSLWSLWLHVATIVISFALGVSGLILLRRFRAESKWLTAPPTLASQPSPSPKET